MGQQDKLFNQIKSAAENAETKDFPSMDKVWNRVEEKLDQKVMKKETNLWKKIAVAATVLLVASVGYQFLKTEPKATTPNATVVSSDTTQTVVPNQTEPTQSVASSDTNAAIKKDAAVILKKQIGCAEPLSTNTAVMESTADKIFDTMPNGKIIERRTYESYYRNEDGDLVYKSNTEKNIVYSKSLNNASNMATINNTGNPFKARVYDARGVQSNWEEDKSVVMAKKEAAQETNKKQDPLIVLNGVATKKELSNLNEEEIESLVELKNPLYIINGVRYSEEELFGPNPSSPYAPLNKQEIESTTVFQPEKAVTIYGKKGENGVVIITTKNGKPLAKKGK